MATVSGDIEQGPAEGQSVRSWLETLKNRHGMTADEIVFQTSQSDPCWIGTPADHEKADWAANYYHQMVRGREDNHIHTRGMHYWLLSVDEEVLPPTESSQRGWDVYENSANCYQELVGCLIRARVLGRIPIDAVRDESAIATTFERPIGWAGPLDPQSGWSENNYINVDVAHIPDVSGISRHDASRAYQTFEKAIEAVASNIADKASRSVDINTRRLRPYYIEVWSEKTLPSEVESVIQDHPVGRYVQGSGHSGYFHVGQFIENVKQAETPGYLLYLSDWDSAGEDMPAGGSVENRVLEASARAQPTDKTRQAGANGGASPRVRIAPKLR